MTVNLWTDLEKLAASFAASSLTSRRQMILTYIDKENPVLIDAIKKAIEKAEPGGIRMALVAGVLNKILDGLEDQEKAALPTAAADLLDYLVATLTTIATQ